MKCFYIAFPLISRKLYMPWLCLEYSFFDVEKKVNIIFEIFSWMNVIYTESVSGTNIPIILSCLTNYFCMK